VSLAHLSQAERRLIGSMGAHKSWAQTEDRQARTQPARDALQAKFERLADPDGTLDADELARRVKHLKAEHFARLQYASVQARKRKGGGSDVPT
jgi:hypothetical protein